jgi:hypothetical protein
VHPVWRLNDIGEQDSTGPDADACGNWSQSDRGQSYTDKQRCRHNTGPKHQRGREPIDVQHRLQLTDPNGRALERIYEQS